MRACKKPISKQTCKGVGICANTFFKNNILAIYMKKSLFELRFPEDFKNREFYTSYVECVFYDEQFLVFGFFSSIRHIRQSAKNGQFGSVCVFSMGEFLKELGKPHKGSLKLVLFDRKGGVVKQVEFVEPRFSLVENFFNVYNTCASNNIFVKVEFKEKLEFV